MIFTHTGVVESVRFGKKRIPLVKSGKYWKSETDKFNHVGVSFSSLSDARLYLESIKINE